MLKILPPLLILVCVSILLFPALRPGQALLPGGDLAFMSPWNSVLQPSGHQWNPLMWDALAQFYPWRAFYHRAFSDGKLPLWNKYQFCGAPLYANVQSAIFYPPNLIFYLMDPARAFGFCALLHLFLAGLFAFLLARHLGASSAGATVSGLAYSLCAFNITWLELPTFANVAAWLPLALLLVRLSIERQSTFSAMAAGITLGLALLAGHFQIAFYVLFAAFAWGLWSAIELRPVDSKFPVKSFGILVIAALAAFCLAAVQILPSLELAGVSHRAGRATLAGYYGYAATGLPPMNLITAFVPDFFGNPSRNTFWGVGNGGRYANYAEFAMYAGMLPLILAIATIVFDRKKKTTIFFALLAAFSILVALGTPLSAVFYFCIPGFSSTGSPARMLLLYCFSISILAGFGATTFAAEWPERLPQRIAGRMSTTLRVVGASAGLFAAAGLCTWFALSSMDGGASEEQIALGLYSLLAAIGMFLVGAAILISRAADMIRARSAAGLMIIVTAADLLLFGYHYNAVSSTQSIYPMTKGLLFLQETIAHDRIMPINARWNLYEIPPAVIPPNSATAYGLNDMQGYDSLFPASYKKFAHRLQGQDPSPEENGNMVFFKSYSPETAQYAHYIVTSQTLSDPSLELVYEGEFYVYSNPRSLPRVEAQVRHPSDSQPSVRWIQDDLNNIEVEVASQSGSRLILRDTFYPGWKAYINDEPAAIHGVEQVYRSVSVRPHVATVRFQFDPSCLRIGLFISLMCLSACTAWVVIRVTSAEREE